MSAYIKYTLLAVFALLQQSCGATAAAQLKEVLGVAADEQAAVCLEITIVGTAPFGSTSIRYKKLELPEDFDNSTMTPEALKELDTNLCP